MHRRYLSDATSEEEQGKRPLPASDYIHINYFGLKMTENWYRQYHQIPWWQPSEPFTVNDSKNPANVNMRWFNEEKINNRLPNYYVF